MRQHTCTAAEINQLAAAPEGHLLAAADDDGCVTIIDHSNERFACHKLNGRHDNIASSVVFRRHKPNEGQPCMRWSYFVPLRCCVWCLLNISMWCLCNRQWVDKPFSAAVISGGLDCQLMHWAAATRGIITTRQAGELPTLLQKLHDLR